MGSCGAYQASDMMYCPRCKLAWDVNDPEPPPCGGEPNVTPLDTAPEYVGADLAAGPDRTVFTFTRTPTLAEFAQLIGYKITPWQRVVLDLVDKQHGR